jgi:PAS domain S-box-containing protein
MDAQITRQPIRISRWMKYIVVISVVAVLYVITARLGLSLALPPEGKATSVWPPSGIALAAVLIVGCRVWPGIWLGAFLGNFWDYFEPTSQFSLSSHLWVSSGIAVGSTLQPLLGTYLIRRLMGRQNPLDSARNVFQFLGSALLMCLVASTVGVTLLFSTGFSAWTNLGFNWLTWWLGDLMGILVVTPLALTWRQAPDFLMSPRRMAEAGLLLMVLLGVGLLNFGGWGPWGIDSRFLLYLTVPPLVWAALRFGRHGATVALLVVLGIAVWGTAHQRGPWVMPTLNESLILLQTFMGVLAVTTLTLASVLTERQRGEAALKESRERLRLAQQAGRIGVWDWNVLSGELVRDGAEPMDGLDHKSLGESLETYLQNVHSQDREALINAVNQAVEHGGELDQEYRIVWPDASIHWAHAKGHALQDDQGRTVRLTGTCEDITRRKELEEAAEKLQGEIVRGVEAQLKETREMFYSLFEFAPDAILVVNESGVIIRVNSKTEQLFGYSREELAGQAVELLVPHRFAREHVGHRSQYLQDPNTRPMGVGLQLFGRPKDGTEFPVDIMLSPFDTKEGRMVRATIRDVTERKRAEEELGFQGQIIRDMAEGVNVVRADDGIIIYTNPKFEEMFGYGPGELIGRSVSILNTPGEKSPEQVVEEITTVLER